MTPRKSVRNMLVRREMCSTCVFKAECDGGIELAPGRREEIQRMLLTGTNQICHQGNRMICRGGRDFQLKVFASLGIIPEPTDEALRIAMEKHSEKNAPRA